MNSLFSIFTKRDDNNGEPVKGVRICRDLENNKPIIIPHDDRFLHTMILGQAGCSKAQNLLLPMIEQDIQNSDCGVIVIDPIDYFPDLVNAMGKLYNKKVVYFNPVRDNCVYFNPLKGEEIDVIEQLTSGFGLINNRKTPQKVIDVQENLLRYSLKVIKRLYRNQATFKDLLSLIQYKKQATKIINQFYRLKVENQKIMQENQKISL